MLLKLRNICLALLCLLPALPAVASEEFRPAMIYVTGALESERAFIEMARQGAEKAKDELNIGINEYRLPENEDPTGFIRHVAEQGYSPIVAVGYQNVVAVLSLADEFPETKFTVIDGLVPPIYQNVQSVVFRDHEGAFLVGMIAAYTSKSQQIGFVGGMDVPLIRNFALGYEQGARFVRPDINIDSRMVGNTADAWSRPDIAYDIATSQYQAGVDVIFTAAGGSSTGVLRAANDADKFGIGVDSNQNGLYPGHVLTSMVKRVDKAVFETLRQAFQNNWQAGIKVLGLKEGALDFAIDQHNRKLVSQNVVDQVLTARERIVNGLIEVKQYAPE